MAIMQKHTIITRSGFIGFCLAISMKMNTIEKDAGKKAKERQVQER